MPGSGAGDDPELAAARHARAESPWQAALPVIETLAGCFEAGLLVLDDAERVVFCSEWMASMLGMPPAAVANATGTQLLDHLARMVPDPPPLVRDRLLLARDHRITCEEFEIAGPPRSVVRWVSRHVASPAPAIVVVCTDITAEIDLAATCERQAVTDPLTGLLNRRGIEPQIFREMHQATRHARPLSVAMLDIDHFKRINDRFGHNVGDQVLRAVAAAITKTIRGGDLAARWGGEEFLLVLPDTDLEPARRAAERIRVAVEALKVPEVRSGLITISGGLALFDGGERLVDLVARADKHLYEAKTGGRNRVK